MGQEFPPSQHRFSSFEDLVTSVGRPGPGGSATIQISEFKDSFTFEKIERYPEMCEEEVERNHVITRSRECFEADPSDLPDRVAELIKSVEHNAAQGGSFRSARIQDYAESIAALSLAHAMSISPAVSDIVHELVREERSSALVDLGCSTICHAGKVPQDLTTLAIERVSKLLSDEGLDNRTDLLRPYMDLINKSQTLSEANIRTLFLGAQCLQTGEIICLGWVLLNECLSDIAQKYPDATASVIDDILTTQDIEDTFIIMALQVAATFPTDCRLPDTTVRSLLRHDDWRIRTAAAEYAGSLGEHGAPFVYELMAIAEEQTSLGAAALETVAKIRIPLDVVSRFLVSQWERARVPELDPNDADKRVSEGTIIDTKDGRDQDILSRLVGIDRLRGMNSDDGLEMSESPRLAPVLAALAIMAPYDSAVSAAYLDAVKMPSSYIRYLLLTRMPSGGSLDFVKPAYDLLLRTSTEGGSHQTVLALVRAYGDDGAMLVEALASEIEHAASLESGQRVEHLRRKVAGLRQSIVESRMLAQHRR